MKRDGIGKKTFSSDMVFRHIISYYFANDKADKRNLSSDDKINEALVNILGINKPVSGKQIDDYRKSFTRISQLAPFVFFK